MPRIHLTQKGFAAVEAILIAVILAIIGGTGYYVYKANNKTTDTLNAANSASQSKVQKKKTSAKKTATTPSYLTIKEWGVKLPLTDGIKDAYYVFKADNNSDAYLSLKSLETTQCAADQITTGAYSRFTQNEMDPQNNATYLSEYPDATKIGTYYYYFTSPQADCSDDQTIQAKADKARVDLKAAVKTIKAE